MRRGQARIAYLLGITAVLGASAFFARAEPRPTLPDGWREIPELSLPSKPGAVRIESRRGYGDPSHGCFALVQRASGEGARAGATRAALVSGLKARGLEVSGEGEELLVRGLGIEGRIRTTIRAGAGGRSAAVSAACFYNRRQPERCKAQCGTLLDRLGGG